MHREADAGWTFGQSRFLRRTTTSDSMALTTTNRSLDEFAQNWLAELAYVGNYGRNLLVLSNIGTGNDEGGPGSREILGIGPITATRYTASSSYTHCKPNSRSDLLEACRC